MRKLARKPEWRLPDNFARWRGTNAVHAVPSTVVDVVVAVGDEVRVRAPTVAIES
jgi:hypothetical protein